jgi:hypothetical protein
MASTGPVTALGLPAGLTFERSSASGLGISRVRLASTPAQLAVRAVHLDPAGMAL